MSNVLITGGSGYFGSVLRNRLRACGETVRVFDMVDTPDRPADVEFVRGDIRDLVAMILACRDIEVVYHCAAMVPISQAQALWSVNVIGSEVVATAAQTARVCKFVHLSSSAVYGVPTHNPVNEQLTQPHPMDPYGASKLEAEYRVIGSGLNATVIRPRTIVGPGRLGIFSLLFRWVVAGRRIPVISHGNNVYQFVHVNDVAEACIRASRRGAGIFNIGAAVFGTMRQTLEALCRHADTGSRVVSVPRPIAQTAMWLCGARPYHRLMYGQSFWFDTRLAEAHLNWQPRYSNDEMICEAYDWYLAHRDEPAGASAHRAGVRLRWCR